MKSVAAWSVEHRVTVNLLMAFVIIIGVMSLSWMKREIFPQFSLDMISVTVSYMGASPEEIEEGIIVKIEEKIKPVEGVKRIISTAREGMGTIILELKEDVDNVQKVVDDVKTLVDTIDTFPEEAEEPVVKEVTRRAEVLNVAVYGDVPESTIKHLTERIKDDITNLPGITYVEVSGIRQGEIHIEISEQDLRRYELTLGQVAEAVRRGSLDMPAGSIKTTAGEILVRTKGRRYYAADYKDIAVITRPDGSKVTLGQIVGVSTRERQ